MEFLTGFIVGWVFIQLIVLGIQILQKRKRDALREELAENLAIIEQQLKDLVILRAEKVGSVIYVYNQVTNEFICQGADIEEVNSAWLARYPGKRALVDEGRELLFKEEEYVTK
jgi:hypothetical protein